MSYIVPMKKPICINCPFRNLDSCTLIYLMSDKDSEVTVHVNEMTVSPDCPLIEVELVEDEETIVPVNMIGGYLKQEAEHEEMSDQ